MSQILTGSDELKPEEHLKKPKIYSYTKCSTCRRALSFLKSRDLEVEVVDITETPPTLVELKKMLAQTGDVKKLFNTSGVQYRELGISTKLKTMSTDQALKLLSENGRLVKRPFLISAEHALVGFDEKAWNESFQK